MSDSIAPPPTSGSAKYAVIGILLALIAVGSYCAMGGDESTTTTPTTPATTMEEDRPIVTEPELAIVEEPTMTEEPVEDTPAMRTVRQVECNGNLSSAQVMSVVGPANRQVRACYERRLKVNNVLQGNLQVSLLIGNDGSVDQVRVGGTLRDNEVFSCVRGLAQSWRFPAPQGGCVQVNVPFNLSPRP